jgi:hypothetical protein
MPRLRPLEQEKLPAEVGQFFEQDVARWGAVLNNTRQYAYNPAILAAIKTFAQLFDKARALRPAQKGVLRVRVAKLNGCPF